MKRLNFIKHNHENNVLNIYILTSFDNDHVLKQSSWIVYQVYTACWDVPWDKIKSVLYSPVCSRTKFVLNRTKMLQGEQKMIANENCSKLNHWDRTKNASEFRLLLMFYFCCFSRPCATFGGFVFKPN